MHFLIADSFTDALARLPAAEQKAAKVSALDYQLDPSAPGLQFHRIDRSKDPNFWSMRVNRDLRIIVHKTNASVLLAYVDHHDKAYAWAERRRIEAHPTTGAVQIVEVKERVEETAPELFAPNPTANDEGAAGTPASPPPLFAALSDSELLSVGVPSDWVEAVRAATEDRFFDLCIHLPAEAAEALLAYAADGVLRRPEPAPAPADPFAHPDAQRRFRVVADQEELAAALDAPWDRWSIFLHPSQREVVERRFTGPARVAGSAGTGKTVVAVHRAVRLARADARARVLLTTFSQPLADALRPKVDLLAGTNRAVAARVTVTPWMTLADELHQLAFGRRPRIASEAQVLNALHAAADACGVTGVSDRFLLAEFNFVVDAWQVPTAEVYAATPRLGRRTRLGARQREQLWTVFSGARAALVAQGLTTWPAVFAELTQLWAARDEKPFTHVVVDEAQDLGVPELRLLSVLTASGGDSLFFAGDLGQRIFQPPFSWKGLGVDVRGRATTLKVNYRTSHQIRAAADRLLPSAVHDVDGAEEVRRGVVSVFDGPPPSVIVCTSVAEERRAVADFLRSADAFGAGPEEMGVFVRSRSEFQRARDAVRDAELIARDATEGVGYGRVLVTTMHLAKGLEFKAVVVMACDAAALPDSDRISAAVDESELDEVYETERQLFYVACTRARDRLLVSGVTPASEFLSDLPSRSVGGG